MAKLSSLFRFIPHCHWPGPRSLATTYGVSVDVLSFGYLDVSVPRVRFLPLFYSKVRYLIVNAWKPLLVVCAGRPATRYRAVLLPHTKLVQATHTGQ